MPGFALRFEGAHFSLSDDAEYLEEAGEGFGGFGGVASLNRIFQIKMNRKTAPIQIQGLVKGNIYCLEGTNPFCSFGNS